MERRLTTIMAADVVGYAARMQAAEQETIGQLAALTAELHDQVSRNGGRIFSRAGDGFLSEFASPVSAVRTGFEIQRRLRMFSPHDRLQLRMGIHLADVVVDGEDLLGDGVNIAARVEGVAEPGSVLITRSVFDQVKRAAQLTFVKLGPQPLKNIAEPIELYRVVGELGVHSYAKGAPTELAVDRGGSPAPVNPHSIAVLPFANFSGDLEQEYFSDGFSEDLITELSRFRQIFVLSRNASFALKGRNMDLREVGRTLRVAYCLEGSVRKMGSRVRITSQLIDTQTGDHVWAERHDCDLDRLFEVQDELAASIVSMVVGNIEQKAAAQARRKQPADMLAYDCLLHGLELHRLGGITRENVEEAVRWFEMAIAKDPNYGRAYAWRACALATLGEWTGQDLWKEVIDTARRGLELDDKDAECHRIIGSLSLYAREYEKSEYHFQRALELNPNHAYIVGRMGELHNFLGDGRKALEYQQRAKQLDPFLPAACRELEVVSHYILGEYEQAVRVVAQLSRVTRRAAAYRVAAQAHLDDPAGLQRAVAELRAIDPEFSISGFLAFEFYKDPRFRQQLQADLRRAGLAG